MSVFTAMTLSATQPFAAVDAVLSPEPMTPSRAACRREGVSEESPVAADGGIPDFAGLRSGEWGTGFDYEIGAFVSLLGQILPLVGVALGAVTSFLASSLNDRARWRREQSVRWDERRLDAYGEYVHAVKELAGSYQRIAAGRGLVIGPAPLELTAEVLAELGAAESRRSALGETCELLGDTDTNTASKTLNHCLWRLEHLARGVPTQSEQSWEQAYLEFRDAQRKYLEYARVSLGVTGPVNRVVAWPSAWRPVSRPSRTE
ncbi:hypothetical protein [Streptomyces sp. NPDC059916]|uniref:hypothetical protein n=1 Tax=Streptomyces sp. NPDC059916 TaxID=3347001 RepID=UPI00369A2E1A